MANLLTFRHEPHQPLICNISFVCAVCGKFFLFMGAVSLGLYAWGSFREFTADTQFFLLRLAFALGLSAGIFSFYCIIINMVNSIRRVNRDLPFWKGKLSLLFATGGFALMTVAGAGISLASAFILTITKGKS